MFVSFKNDFFIICVLKIDKQQHCPNLENNICNLI